MTINEIRNQWVSHNTNVSAAVDLWNAQSSNTCYHEIPLFSNNQFLKLLEEKQMLKKDSKVLDIGCGVGVYSMAIAPKVESVVGLDLSEKMISYGTQKLEENKIGNVALYQNNWSTFDIKKEGYEQKFDLVFAHMTPAICDAETFEKMNACSKRYCVFCKPTRRNDPVSDEVKRRMGVSASNQRVDNEFLYAVSMLWQMGYCPELSYEQQVWHIENTFEEACATYINRVKVAKEVSKQEIKEAKDYLHSIEKDGKIIEDVTTTIATLFWEK